METTSNRRLLAAWLLLVVITVSYLGIDHRTGRGVLLNSSLITVAAICLALVKVRIIMREFMEVRTAPPLLCRITDVLVIVMAIALVGAYTAGRLVA